MTTIKASTQRNISERQACNHRSKETHTICFQWPIPNAIRPDARAHGGITTIEHCRCTAIRRTNSNQGFSETSGWMI